MSMLEEMEDVHQLALGCPDCGTDNPSQRKFCARCGTLLWEPCLQCGELCARNGNYCGACGANLADAAAGRLEQIDTDFRAVAEMQAACRFDEALALLAPISKNEHPRMVERALRAQHLLRQLALQRNQRRVATEQTRQRALACFEAFEYEEAARLLDDVPPTFRTEEIEELRTRVAARRERIERCAAELRSAVREKRTPDIPRLIERLLALKPDHSFAQQVAGQMQQHLVRAAETRLAAHQYDESLRLLEQIDPRVRTPQSLELCRHVAELAHLMHDLRHAPVIDKTLFAAAERLQRLAPGDARTSKLHEELRRRMRQVAPQSRWEPPVWARPPKQTPWGVPVDWHAGLRQIGTLEGLDSSALARNPGRFAVACGLALAGVRQAALRINLRPTRQQGMVRRVTRLMQSDISTTRKAWGLDLGVSGLKAIKMSWHEPRRAVIEAVVMIEHAKPLSQAANDVEQKGLVADTLRKFLEAHPPKTERMCIGLPGRMALARYVELPAVKDSKARKLILFEASNQFPVPLERLDWDYQILDDALPLPEGAVEPKGGRRRRALLIGVQRHSIERFVESFRLLGLSIDVLQPDSVALHNFLVHELFPGGTSPGEPSRAVAAIDMGADVTNLIISSPQSFWFHSCGVAGHGFSRALVKHFKLSLTQAEQLKRAPESAERLSEVYDALAPVLDDLTDELRQSLAAYAALRPDLPIERLIGLGGGFCLHGLLRYLRGGR